MTWLLELYFRIITPREDEDKGAAMVEYGLLVSLIAVVVAVVLVTLGPAIAQTFTDVMKSL